MWSKKQEQKHQEYREFCMEYYDAYEDQDEPQENRLHPSELEECMDKLTPWMRHMAYNYAGGELDLMDDLMQEAAFAIWQFDTSKVEGDGLSAMLRKVARYAMTNYLRAEARRGVVDLNKGRWGIISRNKAA